MSKEISCLLKYGLDKKIFNQRDMTFITNNILSYLNLESFNYEENINIKHIDEILDDIINKYLDYKYDFEKENHKSKIISFLMKNPSNIQEEFNDFKDKEKALNWFYQYNIDINYIKEKKIALNKHSKYQSNYGLIDITINYSKPEKSVEEIKLMASNKNNNAYLKCPLCIENEGYFGDASHADRSNHRMIEISLNNEEMMFQYSPYSYFKEHCIILTKEHIPMNININTFKKLIDFTNQFNSYFIGSNADIAIVGGSLLGHDHYQAGRHTFPIEKASVIKTIESNVKIELLDWPLNTIRLTGNENDLLDKVQIIMDAWYCYDNEKLNIRSKKDNQRQNAITPMVRKIGEEYVIYLILRNNATSDKYPDGIYHPHSDKHHIKKENIGLIEAFGQAILPARLISEMQQVKEAFINKEILDNDLIKHQSIYDGLKEGYDLDKQIEEMIGKKFSECLEDCAIFKDKNDFIKFVTDIL